MRTRSQKPTSGNTIQRRAGVSGLALSHVGPPSHNCFSTNSTFSLNGQDPVSLRKDPAHWSGGDKKDGKTSTKVITTKVGAKTGLFRFPMIGDIIDSFVGENIAKKSKAPPSYPNVEPQNIPHHCTIDLRSKTAGGDNGLTKDQVTHGSRATHFAHADKLAGTSASSRKNRWTWHHTNDFGKMELIDMNVHGAMWHYGGIAGWANTLDTQPSDQGADDNPS